MTSVTFKPVTTSGPFHSKRSEMDVWLRNEHEKNKFAGMIREQVKNSNLSIGDTISVLNDVVKGLSNIGKVNMAELVKE